MLFSRWAGTSEGGAYCRYHHTHACQIRNPRPETRRKSEARNPKGCSPRELPARCSTPSFGLRISSFLRVSGFGFRVFGKTELVLLAGCARAMLVSYFPLALAGGACILRDALKRVDRSVYELQAN
jgi:hypothetical protein